jgi:ribosomal protein L16/L10AE
MAGDDAKMNIRSTMKIYPRPDTYYRNKSSLDFDMMKTKIMEERSGSGKESMILWIAHVVVGIGMGTIAFMMTFVEDKLTEWRYTTV